ncbi:MAG: pallilysin-related adhesin [Treponema sp.]|nr:pallilysin-related adhesin [Treponema sp.]MBP5753215.1 pallilysin-related adhesin [Treponema sp.]
MHKKVVFAVFVLAIGAIALIYIQHRYFTAPEEKVTASRVVVPKINGDQDAEDEDLDGSTSPYMDPEMVSLVPLNPDETLISTVDMDFDGDLNADQVNAIRTESSPYITLIVGLFNPQKGEYERLASIATPIRQAKTFSYTGIDLTGDHRIALVYQGFVDTGNEVLQAFFITRTETAVSVTQIANLECDGSIYIQQTDRSDAYNLTGADGDSFSIIMNTADPAHPNSTDQIQSRYDWNEELGRYELAEQIRQVGANISAADMARIQDGSKDTFAKFLNGLWYKTDEHTKDLHYIFFDWDNKQIIFLLKNQEEVFDWQNNLVRRNGIYITATNLEIQNLQRRVDVSLRSTDEVRVIMHDDLRILVAEGAEWNGDYKKMNDATAYIKSQGNRESIAKPYVQNLESGPDWRMPDGTIVTFADGNYIAVGDTVNDAGSYVALDYGDGAYIQFRSATETPVFSKTYSISYGQTQDGEANTSEMVLVPYVLSPSKSYASEDHVLLLTRHFQELGEPLE